MTDPERRQRVEDLCDAALDRDARERAAFVAAACGHDEALRQEVEALLAHAQTAEGFLAAPIGEVAAHVLADEHRRRSWAGRSVRIRFFLASARAGWARCIAPAIRSWAAMSPSRSWQTSSFQTRSGSRASNARRGCWRR